MNLHQLISYLKFIFSSSNEHGVHSPYVYNLCTKCFYDKKKHNEYKKIKNYISHLENSKDIIEIEDFGAGSKVFKDNKRPISKMAKVAGSDLKEASFLFKLVKYSKAEEILEFGTSLGISTYAMEIAGNSKITTVEGSKAIFDWNKNSSTKYFEKTTFINSTFEEYLLKLERDKTFDLIYIDGNHSYKASIEYFNKLKKHIHNNSIIVMDDIYWSEEMTRAWEEIKNDDLVKVTIDTFHFGLVFFRKEQTKEHFKIRI